MAVLIFWHIALKDYKIKEQQENLCSFIVIIDYSFCSSVNDFDLDVI